MPAPISDSFASVTMSVSVIIPTYRREQVLVESIRYLHALHPPADEIVIVDQSERHDPETTAALQAWHDAGRICWLRLTRPSITHAMNTGLMRARGDIIIFLDDDIIPDSSLLSAHAEAHTEARCNIVAGQVLQPGENVLQESLEKGEFRFCFDKRRWIREFIGCNFSVKRQLAIELGGFDENFVRVAYRYEAEFCDRAISAGEQILFEPAASIRHLKAGAGGTRSFGEHLTTIKPHHAVGAYYYLLRARHVRRRWWQMVLRPLRAVRTRHHARRPWWIPFTLASEFGGFVWALVLRLRGPKLVSAQYHDQASESS